MNLKKLSTICLLTAALSGCDTHTVRPDSSSTKDYKIYRLGVSDCCVLAKTALNGYDVLIYNGMRSHNFYLSPNIDDVVPEHHSDTIKNIFFLIVI